MHRCVHSIDARPSKHVSPALFEYSDVLHTVRVVVESRLICYYWLVLVRLSCGNVSDKLSIIGSFCCEKWHIGVDIVQSFIQCFSWFTSLWTTLCTAIFEGVITLLPNAASDWALSILRALPKVARPCECSQTVPQQFVMLMNTQLCNCRLRLPNDLHRLMIVSIETAVGIDQPNTENQAYVEYDWSLRFAGHYYYKWYTEPSAWFCRLWTQHIAYRMNQLNVYAAFCSGVVENRIWAYFGLIRNDT